MHVLTAGANATCQVDPYTPGRDSGIVDISGRVRVLVEPVREWRQMLRQVCDHACVRVPLCRRHNS